MAKQPTTANVRIVRIPKTSHYEAGVYRLPDLTDGAKILIVGHAFWPDHDLELHESIIAPMLDTLKPDWVIMAGNMLHDDPFNELAPRRLAERNRAAVHHHAFRPELDYLRTLDGWENRVAGLFSHAAKYLTWWAEAGNSRVMYIPSASQLMPREFELMAHLYRTMEYLDGFRATHDFDPPEGVVPAGVRGILRNPVRNASNDFAQLLGITDRRVQVCNFGSAIEVGEDMKVEIGDFRRRNAGTAAHFEMRRRMRSVTMGFDGKTASGWVTMPGSGLPNRRRQYQFHQLGHLMDRRRMGYLRDYDLWSQGLFFGRMLRGNLHGQSYVVHRDKATRGPRSLVIEGYPFVEATPAGLARVNDVTAALV